MGRVEPARARAVQPRTPSSRAVLSRESYGTDARGVARLHPHGTKAFECRASRKESESTKGIASSACCGCRGQRGAATAGDADRAEELRVRFARAPPLPWLLSLLPLVRQDVRDQKPVKMAEEGGEQ